MNLWQLAIIVASLAIVLLAIVAAFILRWHRQAQPSRHEQPGIHVIATVADAPPSTPHTATQVPDDHTHQPAFSGRRTRTLKPASEGGGDPDTGQATLLDTYYHKAEHRLEQAFNRYERGKISLNTYREIVVSERQVALKLHYLAQAGGDLGQLDSGRPINAEDVECALEAANWCVEWADDQARAATKETAADNDQRDAA